MERFEFTQVMTGYVGILSRDKTEAVWAFDLLVGGVDAFQRVGKWRSEARAREILGTMGFRKAAPQLANHAESL